MQSIRTKHTSGFTLIEILIIAPIVILVIGAFIGFAVTLTGDSLRLREKNVAAYDVQAALDDIETNVVQVTGFLNTTGALLSPQGKDDSTTAFTNTTSGQPDTLITRSAATTAGPFDANRSLIYMGAGACDPNNAVYEHTSIFFVKNGSLYKRTILSPAAACAVPWQRASCSVAGLASNPTLCKAEDERLLDGVTDIDVQYYADSATSTTLAATNAELAKSVSVSITMSKQVAGEALSYSGSVRATSLNTEADGA